MLFRLPSEEELTDNKLNEFIAKHNAECAFRFKHLKDAYETDYQIFHQKPKPDYKPDNRIAVNFAKYMVDTFNGYFIGNPIKISVDGDAAGNIKKYVELLDQYNDQDDNNAELSKICCIYGKGYEMYYVDELGNIGITYLTPFDAFMIYDDSVLCRERYFVRLYIDSNDVLHGSVSDDTKVRWFTQKGKKDTDHQAGKVLKEYSYTTSHLHTQNPWYWDWGHCDIRKEGSKLTFFYWGGYPSFTVPEIEDMKCTKIQIAIKQWGTRSGSRYLTYNGINNFWFQKLRVDKWRDVPNKFARTSRVVADCKEASVTMNGLPKPELGALGNDWETFCLKPGVNQVQCLCSSWAKKPTFKMKYREVFL